jgi:hypothetical protein
VSAKAVPKPKAGPVPLAERRGLSKHLDYGWHVILLQSKDGRSADADAFLDRMIALGHLGGARRDVAFDLFAGRVPRPMGPWGLLVQLKGHPCLYFVGDGLRREWPRELAADLNIRTGLFGADGMVATLLAELHEGSTTLVDFRGGPAVGDKSDPEAVFERDGMTGMTVRGTRLTTDWLRPFKSVAKAHDAIARELNVYVPVLAHESDDGTAEVYGYDGKRFTPNDYGRIDVVTFGSAATLEPTPAAFDLAKAVRAGDAAGVRAAIAGGADPRYLPDDDDSPLDLALRLGRGTSSYSRPYEEVSREQQLAVIEALLDGGAPTDPPGADPAIHVLLGNAEHSDQRTTIAQLRLLLDRGADPNALGTFLRGDGNTPLHVAASYDWLAVMKYLVSRGADATRPDHQGLTPRQALEQRMRTAYVVQPSKALGKQMLDFLAAAEQGTADTSDTDALAEQSWLTYRKEHKAWVARADAALKAIGMAHAELLKHHRGE